MDKTPRGQTPQDKTPNGVNILTLIALQQQFGEEV